MTDGTRNLKISYEVYPPKGEDFEKRAKSLFEELKELKKFNPELISVTYGAGGSNRKNSLEVVKHILELGIDVMPHFTCVCSSKNYIENYLAEIEKLNIKHILALCGDEPQDIDVCHSDFKRAWELVDFIKQRTELDIAVAGYPEKHPKAKTIFDDIENLKKKIDMGGKTVYTQLFFDNTSFYKFKQLCADADIEAPIIAGILPIVSFEQLGKMAQLCDVKLPQTLVERFEKFKDSKEDTIKAGIEFATIQCAELVSAGVSGLHFYTLNKARSTEEILENIL
jgi:methylenetetrahydrofolate reductase (NADPH)